eukprot:363435-Chlamydomonas_euryale.AAC.1
MHTHVYLPIGAGGCGAALPPSPVGVVTVSAADAAAMSAACFAAQLDSACQPALLRGAASGWPSEQWTFEALAERHGSALMSVSRPTGGQAPMRLSDY